MITDPQTGDLVGLWAREEKKQDHSMVFEGGSEWLAQDTVFNYRIVAEAMPGPLNVPDKAEATGTFRTGLRSATVFFDKIFMRLDGDPNSAGELFFVFSAGDVEHQTPLVNPETYGEADIKDG